MSGELFYIDIRDEILQARMRGRWPQLRDNMIRVITRLSIMVQGAVKESKLTGQVLHVRTGTLRRSINRKVEVEGDSVRAIIGTNVEYAGVHEYGFTGTVTVPAHVRRSQAQMALARYRTNKAGEKIEIRGSYRKAGGGAGVINVREHARLMNMPERSYLRSTLREFRGQIREQIIGAVKGSLR